MKKKPLVVIINGSPRTNSNTMVFAKMVRETVEDGGGIVKIENLAEKDIKHCLGCWSGDNESCRYPCVIQDDLDEVFKDMILADGIVFVSGIYWFGITGLLKNLVDRMTCLWNNGEKKSLLDNKAVAFVSSSVEEGNISAMAPLMATCTFLGMHILPYGMIYGDIKGKGDFRKGWGLGFARRCGRNMMAMVKILGASKVDWWGK